MFEMSLPSNGEPNVASIEVNWSPLASALKSLPTSRSTITPSPENAAGKS